MGSERGPEFCVAREDETARTAARRGEESGRWHHREKSGYGEGI